MKPNAEATLCASVVVVMMFMGAGAHADCQPAEPRTKPPRDRASLLLFTGTVTHVGRSTVTFDVDRVWSGQVHRRMTLFLMPGMEVRGVSSFREETHYLVEATNAGIRTPFGDGEVREGMPVFSIGSCSSTAPTSTQWAKANLKHIGPGRSPSR
jgi:hypothetical protein